MASRSRRKSSPAAKDSSRKDVSSSRSSRARERPTKIDDNTSDGGKETKPRPTRGKPKPQNKSAHDGKINDKTSYCLCNQPDDGSPMVYCSLCNEWYHFRCVNLGLEDASELEVYVCPTCTAKTGRRSISECHWFCSRPLLSSALLRYTMYFDDMSSVSHASYSLFVRANLFSLFQTIRGQLAQWLLNGSCSCVVVRCAFPQGYSFTLWACSFSR
ncbi:hypothetical protein J3A83DRAFT_4099230 [Scleroderma citrinum]